MTEPLDEDFIDSIEQGGVTGVSRASDRVVAALRAHRALYAEMHEVHAAIEAAFGCVTVTPASTIRKHGVALRAERDGLRALVDRSADEGDVDLDAEQALADAASPGPWTVIKDSSASGVRYFPSLVVRPGRVSEIDGYVYGRIVINEAEPQTLEGCDATADFMARARTLVPQLIDEVRRLRLDRLDLQTTLDRVWAADVRAVEAWQAAHPGSDLVWPDRTKMVAWLLEEHDRLVAELRATKEAP